MRKRHVLLLVTLSLCALLADELCHLVALLLPATVATQLPMHAHTHTHTYISGMRSGACPKGLLNKLHSKKVHLLLGDFERAFLAANTEELKEASLVRGLTSNLLHDFTDHLRASTELAFAPAWLLRQSSLPHRISSRGPHSNAVML